MSRGIARERAVRVSLEADGWWTARAAGSLGDADVIACKPGRVLLVEVKSTARSPWHGFGQQDRRDLLAAAEKAGAEPWLCWWPPRRDPVWFAASEWPSLREAA